jgi:peptidylprolyl isomerase
MVDKVKSIEVKGKFGEYPEKLVFKDKKPPKDLEILTLKEGDGKVAESLNSKIYCNYHGQIWNGKVFDSSFERKEPIGFALNQVIKGWGDALVGRNEGSRILIAVPPTLGYGSQGVPQAGIKADSVLVFVVDILYVAN